MMTSSTRRDFVKAGAGVPLALSTFTNTARAAKPAERFDVVVAGAGHNSLLCAAYVAKAGWWRISLCFRPSLGAAVYSSGASPSGPRGEWDQQA